MSRKTTLTILFAIFLGGTAIAFWRFSQGLGATTALSDAVPWGLWIAVKLCFIAVAAGAFCVATAVNVFHIERYRPMLRPVVLAGLLFYTMFVLALMFDLGRPLRIWHPIVMWQHHSVLFEVSWCMMLYTAVLGLEFSPAVLGRLSLQRFEGWVHNAIVPLTIAGAVLSVLHQSSLGGMFLIVPAKLHPLWYSPLLPVLFLLSAIGSGLAAAIIVMATGSKLRGTPQPKALLEGLAKASAWAIAIYALLRIGDLALRFDSSLTAAGALTWLLLAEIGLGIVIPLFLFASSASRAKLGRLIVGSCALILGTCLHRFNVSLIGIQTTPGSSYFPTWMEVGAVVGIVGFGLLAFVLAAQYLPLYHEDPITQ
jgi:Ni/Fe-hydrogenase subunit HybB-like protein